jgi:hypothetical protein
MQTFLDIIVVVVVVVVIIIIIIMLIIVWIKTDCMEQSPWGIDSRGIIKR